MRNFLDFFRSSRDQPARPKTKFTPEVDGLESRKLLARAILANWSGVFADPVGESAPVSGLGTSTVQFGTPFGNNAPSSLSFAGGGFPVPYRVRNHRDNSGVQVGQFTFSNTELTSPSLAGLSLQLRISSNVGARVQRVPFEVDVTPNDGSIGPDTIRLIGKPIIRLIRGFSVQIVGFGIANGTGRPTLAREFTVEEGGTQTVTLVGRLIRR